MFCESQHTVQSMSHQCSYPTVGSCSSPKLMKYLSVWVSSSYRLRFRSSWWFDPFINMLFVFFPSCVLRYVRAELSCFAADSVLYCSSSIHSFHPNLPPPSFPPSLYPLPSLCLINFPRQTAIIQSSTACTFRINSIMSWMKTPSIWHPV